MLEAFGIKRNRRIRMYSPQECHQDPLNFILLALCLFEKGAEFAANFTEAKTYADINSNHHSNPIALFISGMSSYNIGHTNDAIEKLAQIYPHRVEDVTHDLLKNPTLFFKSAQEKLICLLGSQLKETLEEKPGVDRFVDLKEFVLYTKTEREPLENEMGNQPYFDFVFTKKLPLATQLGILEYLFETRAIDAFNYEREKKYIDALVLREKGLYLSAVALFAEEAYEGNQKAQNLLKTESLLEFDENNQITENVSSDNTVLYKTVQSLHAHGIIDDEFYASYLQLIKESLEPKTERSSNDSSSESSDTLEAVVPDSSESSQLPHEAEENVILGNETLLDKVYRQELLYDPALRAAFCEQKTLKEKERVFEAFCKNPGPKLTALKERIFDQHIIRNYYEDVWNTITLSDTAPNVGAILFNIPRAIITALSTLWLPVHEIIQKATSVETKLQKFANASTHSKLRRESNRNDKCHSFFRSGPSSQENEVGLPEGFQPSKFYQPKM